MVRIEANFRAPMFLGSRVRVETSLVKIGTKSMTLAQVVRDEDRGTTYAECEVVVVAVDQKTGRAVVIDEQLQQFLFGEPSNQ